MTKIDEEARHAAKMAFADAMTKQRIGIGSLDRDDLALVAEKTDACKYCRFWSVEDVLHGLAYGICKRFPPVPVLIDDDIEDRSPMMAHDDWCGEWVSAHEDGK